MEKTFEAVCRAWRACQGLRDMRRRLKRFTYGRQWDDPAVLPTGETVTEREVLRQLGRRELTHNLLRSLVKTVVGRFRHQLAQQERKPDADAERNLADELDARALEEFLISGCAVQRVVYERRLEGQGVWIDNVSPARFFCNRYADPRGQDVRLIGMLHDMPLEEVLMRHSHGAPRARRFIAEAYSRCRAQSWRAGADGPALGADAETDSLTHTRDPALCRVVEAWTLEPGERRGRATERKAAKWVPAPSPLVWRCRWYAPDGTVIDQTDSPYAHGSHPFVFKLYPLTDGEVHPFIEDVIDQQKYINRLITLIDNIMDCSAKGVLLFPEDAMVDGMDYQFVVDQWNRPGGVIPLSRNAVRVPSQVNTDNSNGNAAALLDMELKLMQQISGVSGALQGQTVAGNNNSATLYESQVSNSAIALLDIYETFHSFRHARDAKMKETMLARS